MSDHSFYIIAAYFVCAVPLLILCGHSFIAYYKVRHKLSIYKKARD